MTSVKIRARSGRYQTRTEADASREPIRKSLTRYYKSRDDATRTREARRRTKARKAARRMKAAYA